MAHKSLYRAWRPERFADVSGQDHIVRVLTGEIESGRISHAYLFTGPRGTGKTSLAKIFAKAVNCLSREGAEPCGKCDICLAGKAENTTDIIEIDAASNNGVDSVRDLRDRVGLLPAMCGYKVYIIDEVHMLSAGAFNALLKTLEEPPAHVIFILATTEPHKLPATIRSRCQRFDFKRFSVETIINRLKVVSDAEGFKYGGEALKMIARAAEGGMRDALSILDQCASYGDITPENVSDTLGGGDARMIYELAERISRYDEKGALEQLRALLDAGADTRTLIKDLADIFRRMLWLTAGADSGEQDKALKPLAGSLGKNSCLRALNILIRKEYEMRINLRADIVLETAVMEIMCPEDDKEASGAHRIEKLESRIAELESRSFTKPQEESGDITKPQEKKEEKQASKKAADKKQPDKKQAAARDAEQEKDKVTEDAGQAKADDIWQKLLDVIDKDSHVIFPYAKQAAGAVCNDGRFEIKYSMEDSIYADFMKQPKIQKVLAETLEKLTGETMVISIVTEKLKAEAPADQGPLSGFDIEIEEV